MSTTETPLGAPEVVWGIVEVMGHNSYGGVLQEVERLGAKFLRVTVPDGKYNQEFTVDLSASSIFRMRECSEETARKHSSTIPHDRIKMTIGVPQGRLAFEIVDSPRPDDNDPDDDDDNPLEDSELDSADLDPFGNDRVDTDEDELPSI